MLSTNGIYECADLTGNLSTPIEFGWIAYGTGTTAENKAHTTLATETDREAATIEIRSVYGPHDTMRFYYLFEAAAAYTVSEVGVFNSATAGDMLGRKLLAYTVAVEKNGFYLAIYDFSLQDGIGGD